MHRFGRWLGLVVVACLAPACVASVRVPETMRPRLVDARVSLHQRPIAIHLTVDSTRTSDSLVLYVTGDGGWRGKDREVYQQLQRWGYATAGVSAPDYLKSLPGEGGTTTPSRLAVDFARIIETSRHALQLSDAVPVVLVGVSRGADLVVVAAGQPTLRASLAGVVAIGLTREEEYVHRRRRVGEAIELYSYLPRLGSLPVSLIQSTGDSYVPAREARALFGADTPQRRLQAIKARNHSFSGARPALYEALHASLVWLDGLGWRTSPVTAQP